jgi:ATP-binding cassette subfamily B protein
MFPGMMLIMNGASCLIVWTAAQQIDIGAMQVGDMIAFITYAMVIISSFLMLSVIAILLPRANVAAERIDEVLNTDPSIADPERPVKPTGPATVEFDQVEFHYGDAEKAVLHPISFTAQPGQTTAIIGGTGSGKSTLLNLIPRFYDVTSGSVRVAGVDVRDMRQADLRDLIGYVPQKSALFSGTIESNLKYAGPGVTDADMHEAARIAQADAFIEASEGGYAREVAQGGTNVSGGQRQRLAIARAIAKRAPILLFDDSFSALDYKTDRALRAQLREVAGNATVIIVAQRIATILHADQIVVLDRGRVAGIATHEELLASCTVYREIAKSQLSPDELGMEGGAR